MADYNFKDKGKIIKFGGGTLIVRLTTDTGVIESAAISGITKANPAVVSVDSVSGFANGDKILIHSVGGMIDVNDYLFTVANISTGANTFELQSTNSTTFEDYTTGGTVELANTYNLGYINDTGFKYETTTEDIKDEAGQIVNSLEVEDLVKCEGIFMQTGKDLIEFLRDNTRSKFYQLYYKSSPTGQMDGKTQELFAGIVKIKPLIDVKANTKRIPFEMTILNNDSALTITDPNIVFGSVETDDVTIAINTYFSMVEN